MAVFLARAYSGNHNMISLRNSYHGVVGATYALTNLSNWKLNVFPAPGFERTMHPDMYRGPFHDHPEAARLYAKEVKNIVRYNTSGQLAGFIAEPIQGAGGIVPMPEGYLKHVYEHVRAAGGICISDEV